MCEEGEKLFLVKHIKALGRKMAGGSRGEELGERKKKKPPNGNQSNGE